ncbi:MAG TPA: DUF6084 family protein [Ktedonobacterales bacterium]|nr:DUF6084 family protein [Ktedonobacterales bacterium]
MPDLSFEVVGVEAPPYAALPQLMFKLRITNALEDERVHTVALRCQIQIAATRRRYSPAAQARLLEVFGEPHRWRETLRPLLWTLTSTVVPRFTGSTVADLPVPCTYDFEVASTKYFDAVEDGEIPLTFLFSGTVFYEGAHGNLQVGQISWEREATYHLPASVWRELMAHYFPNSAWIRLPKDIFDRLAAYRATRGLPSWEEAVARLLEASGEEVRS